MNQQQLQISFTRPPRLSAVHLAKLHSIIPISLIKRKREDAETEMEDVGGHKLDVCEEVSWDEAVEVMKSLKRGKAVSPTGI